MAFCGKCGTQVNDGEKFCSSCGAPVGGEQQGAAQNQNNGAQGGASSFTKAFTDTKDTTNEYAPQDIEKGKTMSILAYFGILFWLPLAVCPDSKFGKFHANQGLLLFIASAALSVVNVVLSAIISAIFVTDWGFGITTVNGFGVFLLWIFRLVCYLPILGLFIIGIKNAIDAKAKELPFIGKIRIIK